MAIIWQGNYLFFSSDPFLHFAAMLILLFVAGFSYKAYKFTKQGRYYSLSLAFALIALGFLVQGIVDTYIAYHGANTAQQIQQVLPIVSLGTFIFRLLTLLGFTLIMLITLKVTDRKIITFIVITLLLATIFSSNHRSLFYSLYIIILSFTTLQLYQNYKMQKTRLALATFVLFSILLLSQICFFLIVIDQPLFIQSSQMVTMSEHVKLGMPVSTLLYYFGEGLQILSYLLLFYIMIRISRK